MIRLSTVQDIASLKHLMIEVFGDTPRFVNLFFKYCYQDNAIVYEEDHEIIAMAFLLPATILINGSHKNIRYAYACATRESHRGKGIMKQILAFAYTMSREKGEAGICLLPASEGLYRYYGTLGFKTFFYLQTKTFTIHKKQDPETTVFYSLRKISVPKYVELRKFFLCTPCSIHWETSHFNLIKHAYGDAGASFFSIDEGEKQVGIAVAYQENSELHVMEVLGKSVKIDTLTKCFASLYEVDTITITSSFPHRKAGMLLSASPELPFTTQKGYLNFCLD